ncbi:MAG TPA: electron transport complex subunit E [Firmicutes bacterium]|jgi:electron transport complex protein RnfE|nr:electron transport complex subunit E [Bacillota bacterium]
MRLWQVFKNGLLDENPTFRMVLGMCPTLAVTTAAANGAWMGVAVIFVLTMSNLAVSLIRDFIPDKIRIPCYVVVIASFVTVVDLLLKAYQPDIHAKLGIFIPLIVVNCIILARAETFASKNPIVPSIFDGLGMGLGFTVALTILGSIRELLGAGTVFGLRVMPAAFEPAVIMILPPGAFITLGFLLGLFNLIGKRAKQVS